VDDRFRRCKLRGGRLFARRFDRFWRSWSTESPRSKGEKLAYVIANGMKDFMFWTTAELTTDVVTGARCAVGGRAARRPSQEDAEDVVAWVATIIIGAFHRHVEKMRRRLRLS